MNPDEEFVISEIENALMFLFYKEFPDKKELITIDEYKKWYEFWYRKKTEVNKNTKLKWIRIQICDNKISEILQKAEDNGLYDDFIGGF